jgi:hypothetical protein
MIGLLFGRVQELRGQRWTDREDGQRTGRSRAQRLRGWGGHVSEETLAMKASDDRRGSNWRRNMRGFV